MLEDSEIEMPGFPDCSGTRSTWMTGEKMVTLLCLWCDTSGGWWQKGGQLPFPGSSVHLKQRWVLGYLWDWIVVWRQTVRHPPPHLRTPRLAQGKTCSKQDIDKMIPTWIRGRGIMLGIISSQGNWVLALKSYLLFAKSASVAGLFPGTLA